MRTTLLGFMAAAMVSAAAHAGVEEVIVTAAVLAEDYAEMPAVTLRRPADFLAQRVRLVNDSRSPELRKKEILATLDGMLKRARSQQNIALSYEKGFLVPVDLTDDALEIIEDEKRADTSAVDIFVKVALAAGDDTKSRIAVLRRFIEQTQFVGRTELMPRADIGLSIVDPEKYRYQILARIAEENTRLTKAMGSRCRITLSGLESRVRWERTDIADLTLYIPYRVEVSGCE